MRPSQVAARARDKGWPLDPADLADATDSALAEILADGKARERIELAKALARLSELYTRALAMSDVKTALSVQKEITRTAAASAAAEMLAGDDQAGDDGPPTLPRSKRPESLPHSKRPARPALHTRG